MNFNEKILQCLGDFPKKTELDFKIKSKEEKSDYTIATVEYNVEKEQRISAFLLTPKNIQNDKKAPGILAIHQHANQWHLGKSEVAGLAGDPMYHYGLELCRKGYVVLAPDLLCFEDRVDADFRNSKEKNSQYERLEFCRYISNGSCLQAKYLHDLSVSIDVLEGLDFVDGNNIGAIGHSMGGQETTWIMWYDKRIKVGVASCGISQLKTIYRDKITHNFAMYVPGMSKFGDISDIVCNIAPRAFMMTNGIQDVIFPIDGVYDIANQAEKAYKHANRQESFQSIAFEGGHAFPDDVKIKAYAFLEKHLR